MSYSLRPHEPQHARPPCPSPTCGVHPNLCPSSWWCHPAISSSVVPFSSCPQSLPASESFPMSHIFFAIKMILLHIISLHIAYYFILKLYLNQNSGVSIMFNNCPLCRWKREGGGVEKPPFVLFANLSGARIPTMANFKLHWAKTETHVRARAIINTK